MTNNTQLVSVPRELLERVSSADIGMTAKKDQWAAAHELRALLAAPAEDVPGKMLSKFCAECGAEGLHFPETSPCAHCLYDRKHNTSPAEDVRAVVDAPLGRYDDVLKPFLALMERELHANRHQGDRPGWLKMTGGECLLEIYYHASKLHKAVHCGDDVGTREFAADVANLAMMLTDITGTLGVLAGVEPAKPEPTLREQLGASVEEWEDFKKWSEAKKG